jgi:hypothetical protein
VKRLRGLLSCLDLASKSRAAAGIRARDRYLVPPDDDPYFIAHLDAIAGLERILAIPSHIKEQANE